MYNKLLINAGGGIVSRTQQAEQDNCATLAIGLGGTGISCLRAFKRAVYTRVAPDPSDDFIPHYSHIQFLAVDTDKNSLGATAAVDTLDEATEFFNISCPDITGLLKKAHILQQDPSLQWLKTAATEGNGGGIDILSASAGAGGIRQIGRLLLLQNCTAFMDKLRLCINNARRGLVNSSINIHIFTGMSGGTGAGTFLDVCYLVRQVLDEMGIGGKACVCGYFFLPDVNVAAGVTNDYIPMNGFASMKELDYAMNFANNGGEWDQDYPGFHIKTSEPPVDLAHFISATDENGNILPDGFSYAMNTVTEYVLEYVIKPYVPEGDSSGSIASTFTMESHKSNVRSLINMVNKRYGASYDYCILGAANTYMPYKEITTYLASKIFQSFDYLNTKLPSDNDIDEFVKNNKLRYEDILGDLNARVSSVPNFDVDVKTLYDQVQGLDAGTIPGLLTPMRDSTSKIAGQLETNYDAILADKPAVTGDKKATDVSVSGRVKQQLINIAATPEKGPFYAAAILYSQRATDLINVFRGYQKRCEEELNKVIADLDLRDKDYAITLNEFQNSNFMNRKSKAEAYKNATFSLYSQEVRISRLERMRDLLKELERQMNELYQSYFSVFANILRELQQTFAANYEYLAKPQVIDNSYAEPILSINDMQESLDKAVGEMNINDQVHNFVGHMMDHPDFWITRDESLICAAVSEYFLQELGTWTSKTIDDYLKEKFNTTDPAQLTEKIYQDIIQPLGDRSAPLFWVDSGIFKTSEAKPIGYLSYPQVSQSINAAVQRYVANEQAMTDRPSYSTDRITIFRFLCGIPMVAYKGVANYIGAYHNKQIIGSHLYEGSSGDPRDSRAYRDIFPFSAKAPADLTDAERENKEKYDQAWELGIISTVSVGPKKEYRLNIVDGDALDQRTRELEEIRTKRPGALPEAYKKYSSQELPILDYRPLPNTGAAGYDDRVVCDHVLGSLLDMQILTEQLSVAAKYNDALQRAGEVLDIGNVIGDFAKALETGVITKKNNYEYDYASEFDEYELTTQDSEPYGAERALVLYSAFLGYKALSDAVKEEIKAEVNKRLLVDGDDDHDVVTQKISEAMEKVQTELEKVEEEARAKARSYPDDTATINLFFRTLKDDVTSFAKTR